MNQVTTLYHVSCQNRLSRFKYHSCYRDLAIDPQGFLWILPLEDTCSLLAFYALPADGAQRSVWWSAGTEGEKACATIGSRGVTHAIRGPARLQSAALYSPRAIAFHPDVPGMAFLVESPGGTSTTTTKYNAQIIRLIHDYQLGEPAGGWGELLEESYAPHTPNVPAFFTSVQEAVAYNTRTRGTADSSGGSGLSGLADANGIITLSSVSVGTLMINDNATVPGLDDSVSTALWTGVLQGIVNNTSSDMDTAAALAAAENVTAELAALNSGLDPLTPELLAAGTGNMSALLDAIAAAGSTCMNVVPADPVQLQQALAQAIANGTDVCAGDICSGDITIGNLSISGSVFGLNAIYDAIPSFAQELYELLPCPSEPTASLAVQLAVTNASAVNQAVLDDLSAAALEALGINGTRLNDTDVALDYAYDLSTTIGIAEQVWLSNPMLAEAILEITADQIGLPRDKIAVTAVRRADTNQSVPLSGKRRATRRQLLMLDAGADVAGLAAASPVPRGTAAAARGGRRSLAAYNDLPCVTAGDLTDSNTNDTLLVELEVTLVAAGGVSAADLARAADAIVDLFAPTGNFSQIIEQRAEELLGFRFCDANNVSVPLQVAMPAAPELSLQVTVSAPLTATDAVALLEQASLNSTKLLQALNQTLDGLGYESGLYVSVSNDDSDSVTFATDAQPLTLSAAAPPPAPSPAPAPAAGFGGGTSAGLLAALVLLALTSLLLLLLLLWPAPKPRFVLRGVQGADAHKLLTDGPQRRSLLAGLNNYFADTGGAVRWMGVLDDKHNVLPSEKLLEQQQQQLGGSTPWAAPVGKAAAAGPMVRWPGRPIDVVLAVQGISGRSNMRSFRELVSAAKQDATPLFKSVLQVSSWRDVEVDPSSERFTIAPNHIITFNGVDHLTKPKKTSTKRRGSSSSDCDLTPPQAGTPPSLAAASLRHWRVAGAADVANRIKECGTQAQPSEWGRLSRREPGARAAGPCDCRRLDCWRRRVSHRRQWCRKHPLGHQHPQPTLRNQLIWFQCERPRRRPRSPQQHPGRSCGG